jgi:hypothetical protein
VLNIEGEKMLFDKMSADMVKAMIECIPAEVTMEAMGMNFRECHPEKSLAMVEKLIAEMKTGARDKVRFWIDLEVKKGEPKHKILIEFYALRDEKKKYIGCLEFTQDVQEIRRLEGQKRLMD